MPDLRFACQPGCIRCCDKPGYVYLTEQNLVEMAAHLNMEPAAFERKYVRRFKNLLRLRSYKTCSFLSADGCQVHPVKPVQCRTYPFWPSILADGSSWNAETLQCPGIGQGPLIQIQQAQEQSRELETALPRVAF